MLSLQRCREILGQGCVLDDHQIESLRDQLYGLAHVVTDEMCEHRSGDSKASEENDGCNSGDFKAGLNLLPESEREDVEERAAIIEFDGGADRDQAEREAILGAVEKHYEAKQRN